MFNIASLYVEVVVHYERCKQRCIIHLLSSWWCWQWYTLLESLLDLGLVGGLLGCLLSLLLCIVCIYNGSDSIKNPLDNAMSDGPVIGI